MSSARLRRRRSSSSVWRGDVQFGLNPARVSAAISAKAAVRLVTWLASSFFDDNGSAPFPAPFCCRRDSVNACSSCLGAGGLAAHAKSPFPGACAPSRRASLQQGALLLDLLQGRLGALPFALDLLARGVERGLVGGELGQGVFGVLREASTSPSKGVPMLEQILKCFDALGQLGLGVSG